MQSIERGMVPDVADFAVIIPALDQNGRQLTAIEPFEDLASLCISLAGPSGPPRTAAAIEALTTRCGEALLALSTRTRAIADSTRSSARSYEAIEGSILHSLTTFPTG